MDYSVGQVEFPDVFTASVWNCFYYVLLDHGICYHLGLAVMVLIHRTNIQHSALVIFKTWIMSPRWNFRSYFSNQDSKSFMSIFFVFYLSGYSVVIYKEKVIAVVIN